MVRPLLRPFGNLEEQMITRLADSQNLRVLKYLENKPPKSLLLIMPRCVKKKGCKANVQESLDECLICLQCPLGDVAKLCNHYGVEALVAFRSHIAFAMARTQNPDLIIATACHDRLIKALRTVPQYPALLAPLPPMEKMCSNAKVDLVWLDKQLELICVPSPKFEAARGS